MSKIRITALGQKELAGLYIGRPSDLGNPYTTKLSKFRTSKTYTSEESMMKYRKYILKEVKDPKSKVRKQLKVLKTRIQKNQEVQINCWCLLEEYEFKNFTEKEKPICHGQIIMEFLYFNITKKLFIKTTESDNLIHIKSELPFYIKEWLKKESITKNPDNFDLENTPENQRIVNLIQNTISKHNLDF